MHVLQASRCWHTEFVVVGVNCCQAVSLELSSAAGMFCRTAIADDIECQWGSSTQMISPLRIVLEVTYGTAQGSSFCCDTKTLATLMPPGTPQQELLTTCKLFCICSSLTKLLENCDCATSKASFKLVLRCTSFAIFGPLTSGPEGQCTMPEWVQLRQTLEP